jgi:hypothetical protein
MMKMIKMHINSMNNVYNYVRMLKLGKLSYEKHVNNKKNLKILIYLYIFKNYWHIFLIF